MCTVAVNFHPGAEVLGRCPEQDSIEYSAPNTSSVLEDHGTWSRGDLHRDELLAPPTAQCLAYLLLGGRGAPITCPPFFSCCGLHQQLTPSLPPISPPSIKELNAHFHLG